MLGKTLTVERHRALLAAAQAAPRWLSLDQGEVDAHYNRHGFLVNHRLAEHPMFELEPLLALCRRLPRQALKHRFGVVPGNAFFDTSLVAYREGLTLDDAIENFEERGAYIAIYNPELDAQYRPVIEGLVGELGLALHGHEPAFNWYSTYVFMSTSGSVTPYHMDREMNFLLQVRGTKTVELWDPSDNVVMSPAQRDNLFSYAVGSRPAWHEGLPAKARVFDLVPGLGVHHPFIAPHLVTTGPALSISLAITFRTPRSDLWTDAHIYNYRFRRYGLGRIPVRAIGTVDAAKASVVRALRRAKAAVRGSVPEAADAAN